jgi:hypothetical protein
MSEKRENDALVTWSLALRRPYTTSALQGVDTRRPRPWVTLSCEPENLSTHTVSTLSGLAIFTKDTVRYHVVVVVEIIIVVVVVVIFVIIMIITTTNIVIIMIIVTIVIVIILIILIIIILIIVIIIITILFRD